MVNENIFIRIEPLMKKSVIFIGFFTLSYCFISSFIPITEDFSVLKVPVIFPISLLMTLLITKDFERIIKAELTNYFEKVAEEDGKDTSRIIELFVLVWLVFWGYGVFLGVSIYFFFPEVMNITLYSIPLFIPVISLYCILVLDSYIRYCYIEH